MRIVITKTTSKEIVFSYDYSKNQWFSHKITLPSFINPTDTALFRIALLARPTNDDKYIVEGVVVDVVSKQYFENYLHAIIDVMTSSIYQQTDSSIHTLPLKKYLSFSGGFDSVAAKAVVSDEVELFSVDFGGAYSRESVFFREFEPIFVKWELRGKRKGQKIKFNESVDGRWLLSPLLLLQKEHESFAMMTGTIMESGLSWFSAKKRPKFKKYTSWGMGPGVAFINPLASLTEFSTTLIASQTLEPAALERSLKSLAPVNSLKALRKNALLSIVLGRSLPEVCRKKTISTFGSNFADDFLALYLQWKVGSDWVAKNYCRSLPETSKRLNMSFVEKYNQYNLAVFDDDFKHSLEDKFKHFGIEKYTSKDIEALEQVKEVLLKAKVEYQNTATFLRVLKNFLPSR